MDYTIDVAIQQEAQPYRGSPWTHLEMKLSRHLTAKWVGISVEQSYANDKDRLISRRASITLRGEEVKRALDAIAPGLVKSAAIAAELLRGLARDDEDRKGVKMLDEALQQIITQSTVI